MDLKNYRFPVLVLAVGFLTSCNTDIEPLEQDSIHSQLEFEILSASKTGIQFSNNISEDEKKNYFNFEYIYNGGGVAIGDINNDGLEDIYFSGNEVSNKLYLNKGNMEFEDITDSAGVGLKSGWKTGVNMVDINADGYLDIHVCRSGWTTLDPELRRNVFYINMKNNTFVDVATSCGLNDDGYSIQASFFDYDKDGDLDIYLTNHPFLYDLELNERLAKRKNPDEAARDKLFRNEGNLKFTEVSKQAGIFNYGHGLSLVTADLNNDSWVDIYVTNDYKEPDYLYINNGDGTFTDQVKDLTNHIAFNAMGLDVADLNNDLKEDIYITEMLPSDYKRSKTNMASMDVKTFEGMKALGLHYQYMHNIMLINKGYKKYIDVSQMTNTAKTDWSWSCLIADLDNDMDRDIFVANGNKRDVFDKDYKTKANEKAALNAGQLSLEQLYELMPATKLPNHLFQNKGDLVFDDVSKSSGLAQTTLSQGGAVADLDNDGDLDIVINNLDEISMVIENQTDAQNYLKIKLKGAGLNSSGHNAKISIATGKDKQYFEVKTTRGYLSSSSPIIHFGLGNNDLVSTIKVDWLSGKTTVLTDVQANQTIEIAEANAIKNTVVAVDSRLESPFFKKGKINSTFKHKELPYNDYKSQVLLPHKFSQLGPFMSKGDVDGDGLQDVFIGGARGQSGVILKQNKDGSFSEKSIAALSDDKAYEDLGSDLQDYDGDGDLDLFVVSGGNEFPAKSPMYVDRLYLNNGKGNFSRKVDLFQNVSSGMSISSCDFDKDGDMDVFIGGRIFPEHYPYPTPNVLLVNDGKANFTEVAYAQGQGLNITGMVTSSVWSDIDLDGDDDLILVGEWMPITIFENDNGVLRNATAKWGLEQTSGWWNKIIATDYDNDGDDDYVIGNLGLNHKFKATPEEPFKVYSGDYDSNGSVDIVLAKYYEGKEVPVRGKECSSEQMPFVDQKFPTFASFASASVQDIIGTGGQMRVNLEAKMFESIVMEKTAQGFELYPLPRVAQVSPINGIISTDVNGDGLKDLIIAGNMYQTEAETTRADASIGLVLLQKDYGFEAMRVEDSGFFVPGDAKDLIMVEQGKRKSFFVSENDNIPLLFTMGR